MSRLLILILIGLPGLLSAANLQDLQAEDKLRIRSWLEPQGTTVVGQEIQLLIEISTPRWFAGGTRISLPEVANLVVLRRNEFATNLSRRENAATWVVQQWQVELYPQRAGTFEVPPITLELAVNDATRGIVRGQLQTRPLQLTAVVPPLLANEKNWLATPRLDVEQRFDRQLSGLVPGDAFTRTIRVEATNVTAMMLPEPGLSQQQGLPAYPDIAELEDRSNRGEATAIRSQSVTYVVEKPGQYRLPEQQFYWWNTVQQQVEIAVLPAVEIDAGLSANQPATGGTAPDIKWQGNWWYGGGAALLVALLLAWLYRRLQQEERRLLRRASSALRHGDAETAARSLYAWLNMQAADSHWLSLRQAAQGSSDNSSEQAAEELLASVYAAEPPAGKKGDRLTAALRHRQKASRRLRRAGTAFGTELNPRRRTTHRTDNP